ncbi:MAG TPA: GNAT family N-acetyltransferase [Planctomycetota bacterium]|nr:GNAT family N-acetyltransferase [Planctomycetota bacterium]
MESVCVRRARREDASTLVEFQLRLARESEGLELDRATVARGVEAVFADAAKGCYWVAEEAGRVVGSLLTIPEWSDWRNATVLWLHSVYIVPEARRRGIFRRLYLTLKAMVESSAEFAGLRLCVDRRNRAAQQVYEALGMSREHYHLYEWLKDR